MGPVMIIDTPGYDDVGMLGELRVKKTRQVLNKTDIAVLVIDAAVGKNDDDRELLALIREKRIPCLVVYNKCELLEIIPQAEDNEIYVSATNNKNIHELKERIACLVATEEKEGCLVGDLLHPGDSVVLVIPIDKAAPKGRLILPQQQVIRDILESGAMVVVTRESELKDTLASLSKPPAMVITDSQVFGEVAAVVSEDIPLTSFSVLMARYKGFLEIALQSMNSLRSLKNGDKILIAEGCTHHRQCNDIGTVKIPHWLKGHSGAALEIVTCSGREFPEDLTPYALVVHCGGCMLNRREVRHRAECCRKQQTPMLNYGLLIAEISGIAERSLRIFL